MSRAGNGRRGVLEGAESSRPKAEGDPIERLLRLAPADSETPPRDVADRVKLEVFSSWRQTLAGRRRRRVLWVAAAMVPMLIATATLVQLRRSPIGMVEQRAQSTLPRAEQDSTDRVLRPGSVLETELEGAIISLAVGAALRVDVDSRVVFEARRRLRLEQGALHFDSRGSGGSSSEGGPSSQPVVVETPLATLTNSGTVYQVRTVESRLEIAVRSGSVRVEPRLGALLIVRSGERVVVGEKGVEGRDSSISSEPAWSWSRRLSVPFEAEGQTLEQFLLWFESETGIGYRLLADRTVLNVRLHGDLEWQDPYAALEPTLRLCGLEGEMRDDVIWVAAARAQ